MFVTKYNVNKLQVRAEHPEQAAAIEAKMRELQRLHQQLLKAAKERIQQAEQTQGQVR